MLLEYPKEELLKEIIAEKLQNSMKTINLYISTNPKHKKPEENSMNAYHNQTAYH